MVGLNPEYLHELMWGAAPRAALARALLAGKLFHFDINDGYRLKHDVDIGVGLVNPLDWLNVLVLLRSHGYNGPFNLDYKPPRTTSQFGVFEVSFPTAVDRFITLWEMAGEVISDPIIKEATDALKAGGAPATDPHDAEAILQANRELLTLHELIAHRLVQILLGLHRGRVFQLLIGSPSHSGCCAVESKWLLVLNNSNSPCDAACAVFASNWSVSLFVSGLKILHRLERLIQNLHAIDACNHHRGRLTQREMQTLDPVSPPCS